MQAVYAIYPNPESAQRAVSSLREAGFDRPDITVLSSVPFDGYEFFERDHETALPWIAALGGIVGAITGFLFAAYTQNSYPLPTGGMAIVPLGPNAIITYEMTMLGAILTTLLTLLVTARLPNWKSKLYDPEISEGKILVGLMNAPESARADVEKKLVQAGAKEVKQLSG